MNAMFDLVTESILPCWRLDDVDEMFHRLCRLKRVRADLIERDGFPNCVYTNYDHVVAYGTPFSRKIGDIGLLGIDFSVKYDANSNRKIYSTSTNPFTIGCARTVYGKHLHLVQTVNEAVSAALKFCKAGAEVCVPPAILQKRAQDNGYGLVCGEVVGSADSSGLFSEGCIYTIDCIYNAGSPETVQYQSGGEILTLDGLYSAQNKLSFIIGLGGAEIIA